MSPTYGSVDWWSLVFMIRALFFFFKQKTAYEMRISDWSSDVCSSDLAALEGGIVKDVHLFCPLHAARFDMRDGSTSGALTKQPIRTFPVREIGRASCRERVCQYL